MAEHLPDLSILIVTYNSTAWLAPCLASIRAGTQCAYEVIVVDNASADASSLAAYRDPFTIIVQNQKNVGFATATNQASRIARGRFLLVLNPDSVIVGNALDSLVAFLDAHVDIGICAPRNLDETGTARPNFGRISTPRGYIFRALAAPFHPGLRRLLRRVRPTLGDGLVGDTPMDVQVVHGNSLCIRREAYERLNGFDENFFMYIEDVDFCLRARHQGWRIVVLPAAQVIHYGGRSSAQCGLPRLNGMIVSYATTARYHYIAKNYGRPWMWHVRAANILSGMCWIGMSLIAGDKDQRQEKREIGRTLVTTRTPKPR